MTTAVITGATGTGRCGALPHIAERERYIARLEEYRWQAAKAGDDNKVARLERQIQDAEYALAQLRRAL